MFDEDLIRLIESRYDLAAVAKPTDLTTDEVLLAAVVDWRDALAAVRAELVKAAHHNLTEMSETDTERARAQILLNTAIENYRYYRSRTNDALFDLPPGTRISDSELARRQNLYKRYFGISPSDLESIGVDRQVEVFDLLLLAFETQPELAALGFGPPLEAALQPVSEAVAELRRESNEDLVATRALNAARKKFDRIHRAYMMHVESLLLRQDRADQAWIFIKRRQPAYAARRRARVAPTQEPEANAVEQEVRGSVSPTPA